MIEILHVSDLHLGKNAYMNGLAKSLLQAVSERYPFAGKENTYLLVTGDVTDHGRNGEYDLAGQALTPFKDRVFITPGNHDYGSLGWDGLLRGRRRRTSTIRLPVLSDSSIRSLTRRCLCVS